MKWKFFCRITFRPTSITHDVLRCGTDCFTQQTTNVCRIGFKTKTQRSRVSRALLTEKLHFILSTHFITSSVFKVEAPQKTKLFFLSRIQRPDDVLANKPGKFLLFYHNSVKVRQGEVTVSVRTKHTKKHKRLHLARPSIIQPFKANFLV